MAAIFPMKGITKGSDLLNAEVNFTSFQPEDEQSLWCFDRWGINNGGQRLVPLIIKEAGVFENGQFMQYHCILHQ
jgi:hypothetical protein